jgi:hypothetical protein
MGAAKGRKPKKGRTGRSQRAKWQETDEADGLDRIYGALDSRDNFGKFDVDSYVDNLEWETPESFDDY